MEIADCLKLLSPVSEGAALKVKVVPGASRTKVAGVLGDRLKLAVAAPPEGGKANEAVCELLSQSLGLPRRSVAVVSGHTQPQKTVHLAGLDVATAAQRLAGAIGRMGSKSQGPNRK